MKKGIDPLRGAIDAAHGRGQKLHAWVNVLRLTDNRSAPMLKVVGKRRPSSIVGAILFLIMTRMASHRVRWARSLCWGLPVFGWMQVCPLFVDKSQKPFATLFWHIPTSMVSILIWYVFRWAFDARDERPRSRDRALASVRNRSLAFILLRERKCRSRGKKSSGIFRQYGWGNLATRSGDFIGFRDSRIDQ